MLVLTALNGFGRETQPPHTTTFTETILLIYEVAYVADRLAAESVFASEQQLPIEYV